jgi:D-alanyl-D-alanine carboxypeptidase (penicillin-binding protein 5/6)
MNKTTVADLAHLTDFALDNPVFAQVVRIQRYSLPVTAKHHGYLWLTTNRLLELYPGTTGVKTGYSSEAGYCLVFSASNGKHNLVGAILHDSDKDSESRFGDAEALLDWGFNLPLLPPKKAA